MSKRLNRRIRVAGIKDERKVFHSFRHTFKTFARECMGEDMHDRITGHARGSIGRAYGSVRLPALKEAIDQVDYGIEAPDSALAA